MNLVSLPSPEWSVRANPITKWQDVRGESPLDIARLNLGPRITNVLKLKGVTNLRQLPSLTEGDLLRVPNFGRVSVKTLQAEMDKYGLKFKRLR